MLRQLLALVDRGGVVREQALAAQLGVSPPVLQQMLGHLEASGYLRPLADACPTAPSACGGCALAPACTLAGTRLWRLTEKGRASLGGAGVRDDQRP